MAHIRLDEQEIELRAGELRIGVGDDAVLRLDADPGEGNLAIIAVDSRGNATVRRANAVSRVLVNGVALGAEPAPLLHGDRIEVAGRQLRFADDRNAGHTMLVPALAAPASPPRSPATAAAGGERTVGAGRLVSLVDGREYAVPSTGLRIGRDAGVDVVVPGASVSRVHAELVPAPGGYVLRDLSANGVFVNGARTGDAQILRRGDVIRVGDEEFRFYADTADHVVAAAAEGSDRSASADRVNALPILTNGTHPAGTAHQVEQPPGSGATVRFGGVKMIFKASSAPASGEGATPVIVGAKPADARSASRPGSAAAQRKQQPTRTSHVGRRVPALVWIAAALALGATVLFVIQDR